MPWTIDRLAAVRRIYRLEVNVPYHRRDAPLIARLRRALTYLTRRKNKPQWVRTDRRTRKYRKK